MDSLTCKQLQKMMIFSCERVEREKEEINKINVFPVPDQDTGSNLAGTLNGVKDALENKEFKHIRELADAALDGALMAAQGNTGIIYTGFLVGFFNNTKEGSLLNADYFADAFEEGYKRARESIQDPKEGTILDVMESFAATFKKHRKEKNIVDIFEKALEKANEALLDTPNKMPLLKKQTLLMQED